MKKYTIDINADVGEGVNNEEQLMPYLSSCNIACGGHAGDDDSMRMVIKLAKQYKVKIGAHPSFPDVENFGRKPMDISCAALYSSLKGQIKALMNILREERMQLHHVKPHGALYNIAAKDHDTATVIIEVMKSIPLPLRLFVPFGSVIADLARAENIPITYEAFADRNYNEDLSLVSRDKPNAIITDPDKMATHVITMIMNQKVKTIDGVEVPILARTFCIHGDNPKALKLIRSLKKNLKKSQIKIQ